MDKTIKIIVVAILSLVMASCAGKQSKSQEGVVGDIVEITPSFTEAVHQFDELYPFSEGLAAVKKNGKFGFIDTKGELIIPCQFSYACAFFEGLSIVMDDEYNISILLRNGEIKHTPYKLDTPYYGLGGWHGDKGYYMFRFQNKKCAIKTENSPEEVIIDENGKKCVNVSDVNFTTNDFYSSSDTICHNPTLLKYSSEKQNIFGNKETYYGIKDSSNSIIASAKYTYIGEYSNGVALCIIFVGNAETKGIPYGIHLPDGEYFFGYIDKKGNTTFTEADMEKIEGYKEAQTSALTNLMQQEEEQAQLEEEQRIEEQRRLGSEINVSIHYNKGSDGFVKYSSVSSSHGHYFDQPEKYRSLLGNIDSKILVVPEGKKWIFKNIERNGCEGLILVLDSNGKYIDKKIEVRPSTHETYTFYGGQKLAVRIWGFWDDGGAIFHFIEKSEYD